MEKGNDLALVQRLMAGGVQTGQCALSSAENCGTLITDECLLEFSNRAVISNLF